MRTTFKPAGDFESVFIFIVEIDDGYLTNTEKVNLLNGVGLGT